MKKLVFATNNSHKLEEVRALLRDVGSGIDEQYEILSLSDIGCDVDIPETGMTFYDNALQKAEYIKVHYNLDCFADDSGLEVRALGMEPGVRSARYADDAGFEHNSNANMDKLLRNMTNIKERQAQFRTVIVLLMDGKRLEFEGVCRGEITRERSGNKGFGYDPVFIPEGHTITFAEMSMEDKNIISHRGKAVRQLVKYLATAEQ
ncbi:MAG: RdgB/HAM1 family non-canonical purine NTP pyrophosphatase [Bacteroidales bacterium]|nr:RdgB/HAM1 family non-canonical purine NTP pyrophosphatase [Bacteroidales bacterium]